MSTNVPFTPLAIDQTDVRYELGPDSERRVEVATGETVEFVLDASTEYPGTQRKVWVHIPAAWSTSDESRSPRRPAGHPGSGHDSGLPCIVFQDGGLYLDPDGPVRGAIVLDNLIASGAIPPTVGIFVDPGVFPDQGDPNCRKNRNAEYDAFDDRYAGFLVEEVLPRIADIIPLSDDPTERIICGGSSGGNAAFTAAWTRPDAFGNVICFLASFAQMPGGNPYPERIAAQERRPIRVFLAAGHRDLGWNRPEMNWFAENLRTAAALAEGGYDMRLVLGDGGHSPEHGGVLLPDALRWIWKEGPGYGREQ